MARSITNVSPRPLLYRCKLCKRLVSEGGLEKHKEGCATYGFVMVRRN